MKQEKSWYITYPLKFISKCLICIVSTMPVSPTQDADTLGAYDGFFQVVSWSTTTATFFEQYTGANQPNLKPIWFAIGT